MLDFISNSVISTDFNLGSVALCSLVSIVLGLFIAKVYMFRNNTFTKSFILALSLLPIAVQMVITLVNGNLGAGVAVAGAFSLIRFRSAPGSAKDIIFVFASMAIGLATGMGYLFYAILFTIIFGLVEIILLCSHFGENSDLIRKLKITIPENLDYEDLFDDLFDEFTNEATLEFVKTTNLGSLFELTYSVRLKDSRDSKRFIDSLRCRNGNLNIALGRSIETKEVL